MSHYLVIGTGSIARRHMANLKKLFPEATIGCMSSSGRALHGQEVGADETYLQLSEALEKPLQFAIIASPAPFHLSHAAALLENNIPVLIEKPLTDNLARYQELESLLHDKQEVIAIGYNIRFMPSAQLVKALLQEERIGKLQAVQIDVGQFLPDWRPQSDYRFQVSAQKALGGGVLLELSHELDYLTWLFGEFEQVFCLTGSSNTLDIDVEDRVDALLMRADGLVLNLHMDFLQRKAARQCKIIGELGTLQWNLLENQITLLLPENEAQLLYDEPYYNRNSMYLDELTHFAQVAQGKLPPSVSLKEGLQVMQLVEAMKKSSESKTLIPIGACSL